MWAVKRSYYWCEVLSSWLLHYIHDVSKRKRTGILSLSVLSLYFVYKRFHVERRLRQLWRWSPTSIFHDALYVSKITPRGLVINNSTSFNRRNVIANTNVTLTQTNRITRQRLLRLVPSTLPLPSTFAIEWEFPLILVPRDESGTGLLKDQSEEMRDRWPLASSRNNADL